MHPHQSVNKNYSLPFEPSNFYHVYNHAVGKELLFRDAENYIFFLKKFSYYLGPYLDLYSYCLLPNHFHLLIKVSKNTNSEKVSEQFRRLLISYSKAFNKYSSRSGTLFERHLKRIRITTDEYLIWLVFYIHRNPVHHGYTDDFNNYRWSSYKSILSHKTTELARDNVVRLFSSRKKFTAFHERNISDFNALQDLLLE